MTSEDASQADAVARFSDEAAIRLGQANQRLQQEQRIFEHQLEKQKEIAKLQQYMGWVILVMLPLVAVVCVVIFFNHSALPTQVVVAASGAFFVDVVGATLAGYKALLPAQIHSALTATTRDPFEPVDVSGDPAPSGDP
ncbi:hypothetical protein [Pseudonocardia sp. ICBG1142]|uniref:hypothetical protein n=1 Tax=Pseudonocardia sp. ICBG1142 TaxID=2846760 RepID=UPI001CF6F4B3|nr:hypothetical protein [Pseudonocardia sp. ICBG1142]